MVCFNLAKHWSLQQIANTFSRSYENRSKYFIGVALTREIFSNTRREISYLQAAM